MLLNRMSSDSSVSVVASKGVFVYACFKWIVATLHPDESNIIFPWHAALDNDGESSYFVSRMRTYLIHRMAIPAPNIPLFIHAIALLDAHQLSKIFSAWKLLYQRMTLIDIFALKLSMRRSFRRWWRKSCRCRRIRFGGAAVIQNKKKYIMKEYLYQWKLLSWSRAFFLLRTAVRQKLGVLTAFRGHRRARLSTYLAEHSAISLHDKKRLYCAFSFWIAFISRNLSTKILMPSIIDRDCILLMIFSNWHTSEFLQSQIFLSALTGIDASKWDGGDVVSVRRQHDEYRSEDMKNYQSGETAASAAQKIKQQHGQQTIKRKPPPRLRSGWAPLAKILTHRLAVYALDHAAMADRSAQRGASAVRSYCHSTALSPTQQALLLSGGSPGTATANLPREAERSLFTGLSHIHSEEGRVKIDSFQTPQRVPYDNSVALNQQQLGSAVARELLPFHRSIALLRANLRGSSAQRVSWALGHTYFHLRRLVYSFRRWIMRIPQARLDNKNNVPCTPEKLSAKEDSMISPASITAREHRWTDDCAFVRYSAKLSLRRSVHCWRRRAARSAYLRVRAKTLGSASRRTRQMCSFGAWLVVTAATQRVNRIANRVLCNRVNSIMWHTFFAWRNQYERSALIKSNNMKLLAMHTRDIKEFTEQHAIERTARTKQEIMRLWSNTVRNRRRGKILTAFWNNTAGRRFLYRAFSRWRLVHVDLYFLVTTIKKLWRGFCVRKRQWSERYQYLQRFRKNIGKILLYLKKKRKRLIFAILKSYFALMCIQQRGSVIQILLRRAWVALKRNRRKYKALYLLVSRGRIAAQRAKKRHLFLVLRNVVQRKKEIRFYIANGYKRVFAKLVSNCYSSLKHRKSRRLSRLQGRRVLFRRFVCVLKLLTTTTASIRYAVMQYKQRSRAQGFLMLLKNVSRRLSNKHKVRDNRLSLIHRRRKHILYVWFRRFTKQFKSRCDSRARVKSYFLRGILRRCFIRMLQRSRKRLHGNDSIAYSAQLRGRVIPYLYGFKRGRGLGGGIPDQARASPRFMLRGRVRRYFMRFRRFLSSLRRQRQVVISENNRQNKLRLELGFAKLMRAWSRSKGFSFGARGDDRDVPAMLHRGRSRIRGSGRGHDSGDGGVGATPMKSGGRTGAGLFSSTTSLFPSTAMKLPATHMHSASAGVGSGVGYYDKHIISFGMQRSGGWRRMGGPGLILHLGVASSMIARSRTSWPHLNRHRDETTTAVSRALHKWLRRTRLLSRCSRAARRIDEYQVKQSVRWALQTWATHRWRRRRRFIRVMRAVQLHEYKPHRKFLMALTRNCKRRRLARRKLSLYFAQKLKDGVRRFFRRLILFRRVYRYRSRLVYIRKMKVMALLFITRLRRTTRRLSIVAKQDRRDRLAYHRMVRGIAHLRSNIVNKRQVKYSKIQMRWRFRNSVLRRLLHRWRFWLSCHRRMQRIARRFRLKPSLTCWASLALGEIRERRIVQRITKLRNKHTKSAIVAAWRLFSSKHAALARSCAAVKAVASRRRRKYAIRAWLKSLDDAICRTKFHFVQVAHNLRMSRKYFYLWHKTSLLSELSTYKSASVALRNWRKVARGYSVQRVYRSYADKEYMLRTARSYLHRWFRHCRRAGYFSRKRHSIARAILAKSYLKYFRRWKRRMFVIARGKFIIRKGKTYSIFRKQPTERIFNSYRCLRVWYRIATTRRRYSRKRKTEKIFKAWRTLTFKNKYCRQAFMYRLITFRRYQQLLSLWKILKWNRERAKLSKALSVYTGMVVKSNVWHVWKTTYARRSREKRLMNLVLYHLYSSRVHAMFLTWKVKTFCKVGQSMLQSKAFAIWRALFLSMQHSSRHILHRVFRGWKMYVTTVLGRLRNLLARRAALWHITHRLLRDQLLKIFLAFRRWKNADPRIKLFEFHKYRPPVPSQVEGELLAVGSANKSMYSELVNPSIFKNLAESYASIVSDRAYDHYILSTDATTTTDHSKHPLSKKSWQRLFGQAAVGFHSTRGGGRAGVGGAAATEREEEEESKSSKIKYPRLHVIKHTFQQRHSTSEFTATTANTQTNQRSSQRRLGTIVERSSIINQSGLDRGGRAAFSLAGAAFASAGGIKPITSTKVAVVATTAADTHEYAATPIGSANSSSAYYMHNVPSSVKSLGKSLYVNELM